MLSDKGIYLGAAANQTDESEGLYDHTCLSSGLKERVDISSQEIWKEIDDLNHGLMHLNRSSSFISSWYMGEQESHEMWQKYGADGVVIVSSCYALQFFMPEPLEQATSFEEIIYSDKAKPNAINAPLKFKNEKFSEEREFRIIFNLTQYSVLTGYGLEPGKCVYIGGIPSYESKEITACMSERGIRQSHDVLHKKGDGHVIHYDLNSVIMEIRLNPNATEAEREAIESLCLNAGLECLVRHSELRSAS